MRAIKKKRKGLALAAAFVLLALAARTDVTYGAGGINISKDDCQITFDLGVSYTDPVDSGSQTAGTAVSGDRFTDLNKETIRVSLYRIASVDVSGKYQVPEDSRYQSLKNGLENISSTTTAQEWMSLAAKAYALAVPAEDGAGTENTPDTPESTLSFRKNDGEEARTARGLMTGLYLAVAEDVTTEEFIYHFTPYLISLPGNAYAAPGDSDEWLYHVTVGLKPGQEDRMGDLQIAKTLRSYNETLGGASFIFEIKAVKNGKTVYSDVCSLAFDSPGTKTVTIRGKIPVKSEVTVKEVYSGACYDVTEGTLKEQHPTIAADRMGTADFSNDYDERPNGGSSIVNAFAPREDGSGVWDEPKQLPDTSDPSGGR